MQSKVSGLAYLVMKSERAKIHLDALNRELDIFSKNSHSVTTKEDAENSRYIRRTLYHPIPPIIGMLLGEFLYCLRSGLDQLAWEMALPIARRDTPRNIFFPIVESIASTKDRKNFEAALSLFPDEIAAEIKELQPHRGSGSPEDHPLWQLNKLCNIDKHRVIPIHSRSLEIFVPDNPAAIFRHLDDEDGVEVSVPLCDKRQMDFDPDSTMLIEFGEWDEDFILPRSRLADIHDFITNTAIPRFARFVSKAPDPTPYRIDNVKPVYRK